MRGNLSDLDQHKMIFLGEKLPESLLLGFMNTPSKLGLENSNIDRDKSTSILSLIGKNVKKNMRDSVKPVKSQLKTQSKRKLEKKLEPTPCSPSESDEIPDNLDSSFTEQRSTDLRKEHDLLQLEKKFFPQAKSISSKDFFMNLRKEKKEALIKEALVKNAIIKEGFKEKDLEVEKNTLQESIVDIEDSLMDSTIIDSSLATTDINLLIVSILEKDSNFELEDNILESIKKENGVPKSGLSTPKSISSKDLLARLQKEKKEKLLAQSIQEHIVDEIQNLLAVAPQSISSKDLFAKLRNNDAKKLLTNESFERGSRPKKERLPGLNSISTEDMSAQLIEKRRENLATIVPKETVDSLNINEDLSNSYVVKLKVKKNSLGSLTSGASNCISSGSVDSRSTFREAKPVKSISSKDLFIKLRKEKKALDDLEKEEEFHLQEENSPAVFDEAIIISDSEGIVDSAFKNAMKRPFTKELLRPVKRQKLVTFNINSSVLKEMEMSYNPFKVKGNTNGVVSTNSILKSMMDNQTKAAKKTLLQKLKVLNPPTINHKDFHIYDDIVYSYSDDKLKSFKPKAPQFHEVTGVFNFQFDLKSSSHIHLSSVAIDTDRIVLVNNKIPYWKQYPQLESIVNRFIKEKTAQSSKLWIDLFKPVSTSDLLMSEKNVHKIKNWINNSYGLLKAQSLKTSRNVLIKQKKKKEMHKYINSFIVQDDLDPATLDDTDTEEDIFMPILLIQGSIGTGKSTSVYSVMNSFDGYIMEINTGVNRGRKDVYNSLKEFCTTQIVHKQNESKEFQRGLVLLEDVGVLFEQDKSFWLVVHDILNISKRPIVLTCEDFTGIPRSIIEHAEEEDSIICTDENQIPAQLISDYLWICAFSQGFLIGDDLLEDFINLAFNGHNFDLRKGLMECQMICQSHHSSNIGELVRIDKAAFTEEVQENDLSMIANNLEALSSADVIEHNTFSLINHEELTNEFIDVYFVDESTKLKQPTAIYELNIGDYIYDTIKQTRTTDLDQPKPGFKYNEMKESVLRFVGSRTKKVPKYIQEMLPIQRSTRSQTPIDEELETYSVTGIPDTSCLNYLTQNSYVLDLLPFFISWKHYQQFLNNSVLEYSNHGLEYCKPVDYRDFRSIFDDIEKFVPNLPP